MITNQIDRRIVKLEGEINNLLDRIDRRQSTWGNGMGNVALVVDLVAKLALATKQLDRLKSLKEGDNNVDTRQ
jgi:hypothetical protein